MELKTKYMGLELKNPVVAAASPLSENVDTVRKMEDSGAAAVIMYSLFEEQINHEVHELDHFLFQGTESYAESLSYFPEPKEFKNLHAEEYLSHIQKLKAAVSIPIIGSLNGVSPGGWMKYAKKIEEAGADALELNIYYIATDARKTADDVERMYIDDLKKVKEGIDIPVAIKVGPYFSAFANMASKLDKAGADALVLFNRFYQPDVDLSTLKVSTHIQLSNNNERLLPLRWIALLYGNVEASLAASTGIYDAEDVIKMTMAGADIAQLASALLKNGIGKIKEILDGIREWMEENEYESIEQMKGSMSCKAVAEPGVYERANYIKLLQSFK